jgi:hypothetical protein
VGSVMTVVVMRRLTSGHSTPCMPVYFTTLAVSDCLLLLLGLTNQWATFTFGWRFNVVHVAACKLHTFAVFVLTNTSSWFLVAMTCQRVTAVLWPLKRALQSKRRAVITISLMTIVIMASTTWMLVKVSIYPYQGYEVCSFPPQGQVLGVNYTNIFVAQDLAMTSVLPFSILAVSNVLLIWKIRQSAKKARELSNQGHSGARQRRTSSLTVTVVVTSVMFVVLTLPFPAYNYTTVFTDQSPTSSGHAFCYSLLLLLWYCSPAVNFYLYCWSGAKFRNEAKHHFLKMFKRQNV